MVKLETTDLIAGIGAKHDIENLVAPRLRVSASPHRVVAAPSPLAPRPLSLLRATARRLPLPAGARAGAFVRQKPVFCITVAEIIGCATPKLFFSAAAIPRAPGPPP